MQVCWAPQVYVVIIHQPFRFLFQAFENSSNFLHSPSNFPLQPCVLQATPGFETHAVSVNPEFLLKYFEQNKLGPSESLGIAGPQVAEDLRPPTCYLRIHDSSNIIFKFFMNGQLSCHQHFAARSDTQKGKKKIEHVQTWNIWYDSRQNTKKTQFSHVLGLILVYFSWTEQVIQGHVFTK